MFPLGHLGIGTFAAVRRVSANGLPWLLLGTLLPDLVDKPVYYALHLAFGHAVGIITGTRTFAHTLLFVLVLFALLPRQIGAPLSLGMLTHLALDGLGDVAGHLAPRLGMDLGGPSVLHAIFFPLLGFRFPVAPFRNAFEHLRTVGNPWAITGELVGAALLVWQWRAGIFAPLRRLWPAAREQSGNTPPAK
jgi:hypothetical protein